jgi:hypothetical protein
MLWHHQPSAPHHFTGCIELCSSPRHTRPAESPCPRPRNRNPWTTSPVPTTFNNRQQYQGWMLTLLGSAPPFCGSLLQPCPGHKRTNGLTRRHYPGFKSYIQPIQERVFDYRLDALPHSKHAPHYHQPKAKWLGLARTVYIYIRCKYGIFGREITKYTVIYGVYVQFWPTLAVIKQVGS